jgi:hypothetical protein
LSTPVNTLHTTPVSQHQHIDLLDNNNNASSTPPDISTSTRHLLDNYADLDKHSRNKLHELAWNTNDENFKLQVFTLAREQENITKLAKLTKDIIKLADTYKTPILRFDSDPIKRRKLFNAWISKIHSILCIFPQTAHVMAQGAFGSITFYDDSWNIGNKAL